MTQSPGPARWLQPGIRVKRWLLLALVGGALLLLGLSLVRQAQPLDLLALPGRIWQRVDVHFPGLVATRGSGPVVGWVMVCLGGLGLAIGLHRLGHAAAVALKPGIGSAGLADSFYRARVLAEGPRIVVMGGGTGLSTMLRGLKHYSSNITAVVTVTDDGGSSGVLQQELKMLPPGDIRNCLVALADSEGLMTELFQHRFRGGGTAAGLREHAFGNLLIAALAELSGGDFERAVQLTSEVLNIRGRVLASTLSHVHLAAEMDDGSVLEGETRIVHAPQRIRRISLAPAGAAAPDEVVSAITSADLIVIGPGSVFTSIIPNLLVAGIPEALQRARGRKVYVCNVMTQPGETDGFSASDHVQAIQSHVARPVFDSVFVNAGRPTPELVQKYRQTGSVPVEPDTDRVRALGYRPITGDFMSQTDVVRHDNGRLAEALMRLVS
ncbi:MAG: YvcK family protein [Armatimonadetes bacterium]|nr:YvcK family protein [Armatimonadota bacterium]